MLKEFKNKKIIITGNTGFKGSWLSAWLVKLGAKVYGISRDIPTNPSHFSVAQINKEITFIKLDICNYKKLKLTLKKIKPDYIFHLAAQALVRESYDNPKLTFETNTIGSLNILDSVRDFNHKCSIVMVTSDKCYENIEQQKGYLEDDRLGGKDPYSASKAGAELIIKSYFDSFISKMPNIRLAIARAGNVIGGGDWSDDRIIPDAVKAWSKGKILKIRSPNATRPWQHVLEPISGYLCLAKRLDEDNKLNGEAFNFGPKKSQNYTVEEVLLELKEHWSQAKWSTENDKNFYESTLLSLNCNKAKKMLGWEAKLKFKENIRLTAEWYKIFYENKKTSIWDLTSDQIDFYQNKLKKK